MRHTLGCFTAEVNLVMTDIELANAQLQWLIQAPDLIQPPELLSLPDGLMLGLSDAQEMLEEQAPGKIGVATLGKGRIGKQFEELASLYFNLNNNVIDINRNIQIKKDNVTLGELDFMIRLPDTWVHLEVAVKFYLLDGIGNQMDHFIGPGRADRLGAKWQHMIHHQLPIARSAEGVSTLASLGIEQFSQAIWIKGALFYHWRQEALPAIPILVNPSHDRGWWTRQSELTGMKEHYGVNNIQLINKQDWLIPIETPCCHHQQALSDVQLAGLQHPIMAAVLTEDGVSSRGFIVPDDWGVS